MGYSLITVGAGHSPYSTGASGNGFQEHVVARQIKDKLLTAFKAVGQKAVDTTSDGESKSAVLKEQAFKCNIHPVAGRLDVQIHLNAGGGTGCEVLYLTEQDLSSKLSKQISSTLNIRDRGAKKRTDLYFLNATKAPAVLIEVCFIDSADDMQRLMMYMDQMVFDVVKVLTGKTPTPPTTEKKVETKKEYYRVIAGSFTDQKNAENHMIDLKKKGFNSFIEKYTK